MVLHRSSDLVLVAERTNTTAARACHCCRAMVHAPMWNSGYGHTIAPRGSRSAPGRDRSTLARCDNTAPLGAPDEPLVWNTTCGSDSATATSMSSSGSPVPASARSSRVMTPTPWARVPSAWAASARGGSTIESAGCRRSRTAPASSCPQDPFSGQNTAPSLDRAAKRGTLSRLVSAQSATRAPWPTPRRSSTRARRLAVWSISAKVSRRSPRAAAVRCGAAQPRPEDVPDDQWLDHDGLPSLSLAPATRARAPLVSADHGS